MGTEKESPAGLTQEKIKEFTAFGAITSSAHPIFFIPPVIYYIDLVKGFSSLENQTSISEK